MFDPDDTKRTPQRRSLLDLAPQDEARRPPARSLPPERRSLLDSLVETENTPSGPRRTPRLTIDPAPARDTSRQAPVEAGLTDGGQSPTLRRRLSDWLSNLVNDRRKAEAPYYNPAVLAQDDGDDRSAMADAEDGGEGATDSGRPLVDLELVARSIWRLRWPIALLAVAGAVGGVVLAKAIPNRYISESRLYADPRDIRLTDSDLSNQTLSTEALLAIIDSQMQVLTSPKVLEKVVADLGLDRDREFGGDEAAGRIGGLREIIFGVRPGEEAASRSQAALDKLLDAVSVSRDDKTFIVAVSVTTQDARKSALIANSVVATFLNEESDAQSDFFQRATAALDDRIAELNKELDAAENAVEKYKADNDIIDAAGKLIADNQLISLNDQVSAAGNRVAVARAKADTTARVQPADILSGAYPEDIASSTLSELRKQYAAANAEFGSLSTRLGPRHPQRVAAEQSLEAVRGEIRNELRRIAAAAQIEFRRATETQADLTRQLAVQKARQVNSSVDLVKLRELERNAAATRAIYESFLKRARETSEEQKLSSRNIRVISQAEPASRPSGPPRMLIAIGGLLAGLGAGIGLGVLHGIYRSLSGAFLWRAGRRDNLSGDPTDSPPSGGRRDLHGEAPAHWNRYPERDSGYDPLRPAYAAPTATAYEQASAAHAQPVPQTQTVAETGASSAASAPAEEAGLRRVHDDLRSLREKVERYARQGGRPRG